MKAALPARLFRMFSLLPHFKGKSRLEIQLEPLFALPAQDQTIDFPFGFQMELNPLSQFERGLYFRNGEPDTFDFLRSELRPGMVFADCGANLGFFSLVASTLVGPQGQVYAFEPTPGTFRRLQRHIELNGARNITARQLALGRCSGKAMIFGGTQESHYLNYISDASKEGTALAECEVASIDALIASGVMRRPDLMKIDVEGSELPLLQGSEKLLRGTPSPILYVELCRTNMRRLGYEPEDLVSYLNSIRPYRIEWPHVGRRWNVSPEQPLPHYARMGSDYAANYIFWPHSR